MKKCLFYYFYFLLSKKSIVIVPQFKDIVKLRVVTLIKWEKILIFIRAYMKSNFFDFDSEILIKVFFQKRFK